MGRAAARCWSCRASTFRSLARAAGECGRLEQSRCSAQCRRRAGRCPRPPRLTSCRRCAQPAPSASSPVAGMGSCRLCGRRDAGDRDVHITAVKSPYVESTGVGTRFPDLSHRTRTATRRSATGRFTADAKYEQCRTRRLQRYRTASGTRPGTGSVRRRETSVASVHCHRW